MITAASPVLMYVDGGYFMTKGRGAPKEITGVYWSVCCEIVGAPANVAPVLVRKQSDDYKTNNDAEWLALREGLQYLAVNHSEAEATVHSDSMIVVQQFNGIWRTKIERHHRLRTECLALAEMVAKVTLVWVPRAVSVEKLGH